MKVRKKKSPLLSKKYFTVLIVCIVTGFIIGFSYNIAKDRREQNTSNNYITPQQESYREDLIAQQERNQELMKELEQLEKKIRDYEKQFVTSEEMSETMLREARQLRLTLGLIDSVGEGVRVILKDGEYNPEATNPNDYIVHERHIFSVLNELKIAGAEAISINGQRLKANSYIVCNGPVITVDGKQHPAPFVIEAVGDQRVLVASLDLAGGVVDQLLNDQIVVTVEQNDHIQMPSVNVES